MPIPKPRKDEKKEDFISRCMSDEVMKADFSDNKQRYAVCAQQLEKSESSGDKFGPIDYTINNGPKT